MANKTSSKSANTFVLAACSLTLVWYLYMTFSGRECTTCATTERYRAGSVYVRHYHK